MDEPVTIVGVDEINVEKGMVSWKSPIGKSLLGKRVGDFCKILKPTGELELEIVSIEYGEIAIDRYKEETWK